MKICILNSQTKICENIVNLDFPEQFIPYKDGIELAPQHDGEIGWTWNNNQWDIPQNEISEEEMITYIRNKRNRLLKKNVDRVNPIWWNTLSLEKQQEWTEYRQQLLNLPEQEGFPWNVQWPVKPE
jgi:hypothetical protein